MEPRVPLRKNPWQTSREHGRKDHAGRPWKDDSGFGTKASKCRRVREMRFEDGLNKRVKL